MQDFRKRRSIRGEVMRAGLVTVAFVATAALAFFAVRGAWGMYQKFLQASTASAGAERRLGELERRHGTIEGDVAELESARGKEEELRRRYGVARPGEGQIVVVRQASSTAGSGTNPAGFWAGLWHALFVW